jgi:ribosomal protein S18 acetylase RimI-like enzyme
LGIGRPKARRREAAMGGNDLEIVALSPTHISDRLEICFGHLDDWQSLEVVQGNKRWLAKANKEFGPTTLIAYKGGVPAGMIEFVPRSLIPKVGFCPCRSQETDMKELLALDDGYDKHLFITCLWVPGRYQREGIGRALLSQLLLSQLFNGYEGALVFSKDRDSRWPKEIHWPAGPAEFYIDNGFDVLRVLSDPPGRMLIKKH